MFGCAVRFASMYWRVAIGAIGALLFGLTAVDTLKPWNMYLILGGFIATLASLIFQANYANTNAELSSNLSIITKQNEALRTRRVFVLLAAFRENFQMELNYHLLRIGRESGLFLQVFCPTFDFSDADYRNGLADIAENIGQYSGGLLVASKFADDKVSELQQFAAGIKVPVIFIDHVPPTPSSSEPGSNPQSSKVRWVTVQDTLGGEKAAQALADFGGAPGRVLVVAGPAKADRQASFKKAVISRWPACIVTTTTDGGFDRQRARIIASNLLKRALENKLPYDAIFCTSDSMTLGCLDAIQNIDWAGLVAPNVIGYDGIEATRSLIDSGHSTLQRVVVQDPQKLAEAAIHALHELTQGKDGPSVVWIEPTLYPNESTGL